MVQAGRTNHHGLSLEILDAKDQVISTHKISQELTLVGKSPKAHVHLSGEGVGGLHVAIKGGLKPVVMDLGGPTPLKINGKASIEYVLAESEGALLEIGERKLRVRRARRALADIKTQKWDPIVDRRKDAKNELLVRVRLYVKGVPHEIVNARGEFFLDGRYGVSAPFRMIHQGDRTAMVQLPTQWLSMNGKIQVGADRVLPLSDWANPVGLERNTVYRVHAGPYVAEILVSHGAIVVGAAKTELFPKDLRKPFGVSAASVLLMFLVWMLIFARKEVEVEEPYPVYARIQNIPVEKLPEPDPSSDRQAGGGSGSPNQTAAAPQLGTQSSAAPSAAAQRLTGGLKNLFGSVLSQTKSSDIVVSETGIGQAAAPAAGGATSVTGKLAAVGAGAAAVAGAAKLGDLAVKGSGQGFSGGSGTGLGTGHGSGIGTGVGDGIGRGGFKLVEEESIVDGGLDKSVIAAVIQNNLAQIKYCYERQLVADPDLFGKVVAQWQINAAGSVEGASIKQTTLSSPPVEQCILSKIAGWKFPQPKNGTKVSVSYPFLFKSSSK